MNWRDYEYRLPVPSPLETYQVRETKYIGSDGKPIYTLKLQRAAPGYYQTLDKVFEVLVLEDEYGRSLGWMWRMSLNRDWYSDPFDTKWEAVNSLARALRAHAPKRKVPNPLGSAPSIVPQAALNRAGDLYSRVLARWVGEPNAERLYEGVHVATRPAGAVSYALKRLKVDADSYPREVLDAPVIIGFGPGIEGPPAGDVDLLTMGLHLWEYSADLSEEIASEVEDGEDLDDALYALFEEDSDAMAEVLSDIAASPYTEAELGVGGVYGDWANRGDPTEVAEALREMVEWRLDKGHLTKPSEGMGETSSIDRKARLKAIELARDLIPQRRFTHRDLGWEDVVYVGVLPPEKPAEDIRPTRDGSGYHEEFPYSTTLSDYLSDGYGFEVTDWDQLDDALEDTIIDIYGNWSRAKYWHGTGSQYAKLAFPELSKFDMESASFSEDAEYDEDDEEE